ncbi:MAG: VOC family protein [Marmoricola sp.]
MRTIRITPNLPVADIEAAKSFYSDYLGLVMEEFNLGWVARYTDPDTGAHVQLVTRDETALEDSVISVHVDDVDEAYAQAQARGYEIVHPLTTEAWGVHRFFVRAPDGNVLNIVGRHAQSADGFRVVAQDSVEEGPVDPQCFTGEVTRVKVLAGARPGGLRGDVFSYEPGARSKWHVHEGEQALVVVRGEGLVQWAGLQTPRRVRPGDWVHVVPGVPHWHGATPDSEFSHLAITASGGTEWREPVAERDYLAGPAEGDNA